MPPLAEQWVRQGEEEGLQKGRQEGTFIGVIQTCRSILGEPTNADDFSGKSIDELRELAERLQRQVPDCLDRG